MAGLVLNSSNKSAMPSWPSPVEIPVYSTQVQGHAAYYYYPGFSGGTSGRSIRIHHNGWTTAMMQYNADGTAVTDGVWNSGMTPAEAAGNANADWHVNWYMDDADNKLYLLTADTGTTPYTMYLSSVNEAGTVTAIGNAQIGNASMQRPGLVSGTAGSMYRTGGDGSGNFEIPSFTPAGGNSASGVPYRGALITINITNGSLSYANLLPSTFSSSYSPSYGYGTMGPTSNNIIMQFYAGHSSTDYQAGIYGNIYNLTTGKAYSYITISSKGQPWGSQFVMAQRWRGNYHFPNYATPYGNSMPAYTEADIHTWVDKWAEYYGLL